MTAYALQRRLQGVGITISSLHPGMVSCTTREKVVKLLNYACTQVICNNFYLWQINTDITRHATPTGFVYCLSKAFFWLGYFQCMSVYI